MINSSEKSEAGGEIPQQATSTKKKQHNITPREVKMSGNTKKPQRKRIESLENRNIKEKETKIARNQRNSQNNYSRKKLKFRK